MMSDAKRYSTNAAYAELPYGTMVVAASDYDQLRAEIEALKVGPGESVAWVVEDDDGSQPRLARLKHPLPPVGTKLYAAQPATADAVSVPRELLESLVERYDAHAMIRATMSRIDELRALLARQEVKS